MTSLLGYPVVHHPGRCWLVDGKFGSKDIGVVNWRVSKSEFIPNLSGRNVLKKLGLIISS